MRVSVRWLRELLDLPADMSARDIADRLTLAGLEVERVDDLGAALNGVVLGQVLTREKHPKADNLSVCTVSTGDAEPLTIVCGAPNCDAGVFTAVATVGAVLPGNLRIEPRELRGVKSQGMLCSSKELALAGGDHAGILVLADAKEPVGTPLARVLGLDDQVLEVSVTPNRPDALSHVGVARDLAASLAVSGSVPPPHAADKEPSTEPTRRAPVASTPTHRVKAPAATCAERGGPVDDAAQVKVEDAARCPRYCARVIEGITVAASPPWLVRRLEACGMRSINNIVDVTNLVMLERGHPLHAFDMDKLALDRGRPTVVVRTARAGEKLTMLDGVERVLHAEDLVICDPDKPIALAGVMGGANSEVHAGTTRILLESAYFMPTSVRRSAKRHGLHTEASHRFERGCDPNKTLEEALNRAAQLIADLGAGQVRRGIVQAYPKPIEPLEVTLRPARAAALLGLPAKVVDEALVARALTALGLEVGGREAGALRFRVPTFRPDITSEVDLVEEVGRLLGMDRIPEVLPKGSGRLVTTPLHEPLPYAQERTRGALVAAGFSECVNLGFASPRELGPFDDDGKRATRITLKNPLGEELSVMRTSLLAGLLRNLAHNQRHGEKNARLFEVGTVFLGTRPDGAQPRPTAEDGPPGGDAFAAEKCAVGVVLTGFRGPRAHDVKAEPVDFYDLRGVVDDVLEALGFDVSAWSGALQVMPCGETTPWLHPGISASIGLPGATLGFLGALHPRVEKLFDVAGPVFVAELDLTLASLRMPGPARFAPLPRFPVVKRDLAALLDEAITIEQVFAAVRRTPAAVEGLVADVELFDLFRDPGKLPAGKKSVGITLTFRAPDRTLTDEAINQVHQQVMAAVEKDLRGEVRKG